MNKSVNDLSQLGTLLASRSSSSSVQRKGTSTDSLDTSEMSLKSDSTFNNLKLTRQIQIKCWRVRGQIATAQKRDDMHFVLLHTQEHGHTDASDIAGTHFFDDKSRKVVAQRLLHLCERYGLLELHDKKYTLTPLGITAIDTERVFVPEEGSWTVWASDDPLLQTPILHYEPWEDEPLPYDEIRGKASKTPRDIKALPNWLQAVKGHQCTPVATDGKSIRVDNLESKGKLVDDNNHKLFGIWNISQSRLHIEGRVAGKPVSTEINAPAISTGHVWGQLLQSEHLLEQWDPATSTLGVNFSDTSVTERESFVRTQRFANPSVEGFETFDAMSVNGVALRETSEVDAVEWAQWRLIHRITTYATSEQFRVWTEEAKRPFIKYKPTTSSREELAQEQWLEKAGRPTATTWHTVAADDWDL